MTLKEKARQSNREALKGFGYNFDNNGKMTRQLKMADGKTYNVSLDLYNGIMNNNISDDLYNRLSDSDKNIVNQKVDLIVDGTNYGRTTLRGLMRAGKYDLNGYDPYDYEEKIALENFRLNYKVPITSSDGKNTYDVSPFDLKAIDDHRADRKAYSKSINDNRNNWVGDQKTEQQKREEQDKFKQSPSLKQRMSREGYETYQNYKAYEEELARIKYTEQYIKDNNLGDLVKRYGIDPLNFGEAEFDKWAEQHNIEIINYDMGDPANGVEPTRGPASKLDPNTPWYKAMFNIGDPLATDQEVKDAERLWALSKNNERIKSSQKDLGGGYAFVGGLANGGSFGLWDAATAAEEKLEHKLAGLSEDSFVSTPQSRALTYNEHEFAYGGGQIAGTVVTSMVVGGLVSGGLSAAGWGVGKATIAREAVVQGITGVLRGGITTGAAGGDWGDIGTNAFREGITGAVGGAIGGIAEKGVTKLLNNSKYATSTLGKLKNLKATAYGVNAVGGIADALADYKTDQIFVGIANNVFDAKLQERTGKDLLTDFAVSLALGTAMNMSSNTKAGIEARVEDIVNRYGAEYMKYTEKINGADADAKIKAGEEFIKTTNSFKKELNEQLFPGKAKEVETLHEMLDVAIDSTKMDIDRAKNGDTNTESKVKAPVSTEMKAPIAPKATTELKAPVSTEGGTVRQDVSGAIERVKNGTATNKDLDMFKASKTANRKMLEDALGMKLPETNMETRKMLKELPARLNPTADNITKLVGEGEKASVEASIEKIKTNLEGTGKDVNELVSNVSNLTDRTVAGINKVFGIEADYGKILDTNLKALADNPDNIISDDFTDTSFVKGYAEAIGEKLKNASKYSEALGAKIEGISPSALQSSYFSNAPINPKVSQMFRRVVDGSAQNLKAVYDYVPSKVEAETPSVKAEGTAPIPKVEETTTPTVKAEEVIPVTEDIPNVETIQSGVEVANNFFADGQNFKVKHIRDGKELWRVSKTKKSGLPTAELTEVFEQFGGKYDKVTDSWLFEYDPTKGNIADNYYNHLLHNKVRSRAENDAFALAIENRYVKPPEYVNSNIADIASPYYGGGDLEGKANQLISSADTKYKLESELAAMQKGFGVDPNSKTWENIKKYAEGDTDYSKLIDVEKYKPLIELQQLINDTGNLIKNFKEQSRTGFKDYIEDFVAHSDEFKDKVTKIAWEKSTPERNAVDTMGSYADFFLETFIYPQYKNEANIVRYVDKYKTDIENLKLTDAEYETLMKYGEGLIDELPEHLQGALTTINRISKAIFNDVNAALVLNGYNPIHNPRLNLSGENLDKVLQYLNGEKKFADLPEADNVRQFARLAKRNGLSSVQYNGKGKIKAYVDIPYYPHGQKMAQVNKAMKLMGFERTVTELPGDLTGRTAIFKPNKKWSPNLLKRFSKETDYDINLWDSYINNMAEIIYHTSDITKLRILANELRTKNSREGIENEIKIARETMTNEELADFFRTIKDKDLTGNNNFIRWLDEYANHIAGKKHTADRSWEDGVGRAIYNTSNMLSSNWTYNTMAYNVAALPNQLMQVIHVLAENNPRDFIPAFFGKGSGFKDKADFTKSDFITARNGTIKLTASGIEKARSWGFAVAGAIDKGVSKLGYQTAYNEAIRKGATPEKARFEADKYVRSIMGDRTKVGAPVLFNRRNPFAKAFTTFQLDNLNTFEHLFKDLPRTAKTKGKGWLVKSVIATAILNHWFNEGKEEVTGSEGTALDPIAIFESLFKLLAKKDGYDITAFKDDVLDEVSKLPFASSALILTGSEDMDRMPIIGAGVKAIQNKNYAEFLNYFNPLGGYNQARKTIQGIKAYNEGGKYQKDGKLQYPIEQNASNAVRGALFGQYAFPESRDYYDNGGKPLSKDQTEFWKYRVGQGENPIEVYNEYQAENNAAAAERGATKQYNDTVNKLVKPTSTKFREKLKKYTDMDLNGTVSIPQAKKEFNYTNSEGISYKYELTAEQCAELQNMYNTEYEKEITKILNMPATDEVKHKKIVAKRKTIVEKVKYKFRKKYKTELKKVEE